MSDIGSAITTRPRSRVGTGSAVALGEGNTTTKADLFSRAKDAIEAGDQSLHAAAEALALAQEDFKASQREIAEAVGKSPAWVNRLLRWRCEGCVGSPFGPGSRARRERQKSVQAPEQRAPQSVKSPRGITSNDVMSGFNSYVTALRTKISKHKVDHFLATPVPADDLAKVGKFLCDLAILKKSDVSSVEQSTVNEEHAALEPSVDPVA
jgi:Homeodomain-like domain